MTTVPQIEQKFAEYHARIKAREERIRREESELERERAALVREGQQHFDGQLVVLRERAIACAEHAARALAALPPKPVEPRPADVESLGFEVYLERCDAYPAARKAHDEQALAASRPLAAALRALVHEAGAVRRQANAYGIPAYQGVGFLREEERKVDAVRGTVLIGFAHEVGGDLIEAIARAGEAGEIRAEHASGLAAWLRRPATQAPSQEPPATIWQRIQRLAAERERPRDQRSQTLIDADRVAARSDAEQRLAFERQAGIRP